VLKWDRGGIKKPKVAGSRPVIIVNMVAPREYMSLLASDWLRPYCSGAAKPGVPRMLVSLSFMGLKKREIPKSMSISLPRWVSMTLEGLRSRKMTGAGVREWR